MYSNHDGGAFALAVRAWCAQNPHLFKTRNRTCPVCAGNGCFGPLPGDTAPLRWACFDSSHAGAGLAGNGCHHGDALDLEAHRRQLTRVEVLRRDGYLDAPAPPAPARAPIPTKAARMAEHWAALDPGGDALDLVRLNGDGSPCVRCYGARGFPAGIRHLDAMPSGWIGSTPRGAAALAARAAGVGSVVCLEPAAVPAHLAALAAGDIVVLCLPLDVEPLDPAVPLCVPRDALDRWRAAFRLRDVRPWPAVPPTLNGSPEVLAALDLAPANLRDAVRRFAATFPDSTLDVVRHEGSSHD